MSNEKERGRADSSSMRLINFDSSATFLSWMNSLIIFVIIITSLTLDTMLQLDKNLWLWSEVAQPVYDAGTAESIYFKLANALCGMSKDQLPLNL